MISIFAISLIGSWVSEVQILLSTYWMIHHDHRTGFSSLRSLRSLHDITKHAFGVAKGWITSSSATFDSREPPILVPHPARPQDSRFRLQLYNSPIYFSLALYNQCYALLFAFSNFSFIDYTSILVNNESITHLH